MFPVPFAPPEEVLQLLMGLNFQHARHPKKRLPAGWFTLSCSFTVDGQATWMACAGWA
ncbi:hypothetical protein SynA1560_00483 [Synechococcus sp. A15-60]|nr:hypothetical protein SynA1560_00483 [Synechococcus sp. A15-60]